MRSRAKILLGTMGLVIAISYSMDAHAFGRRKPLPEPTPSASPIPDPSPSPSASPSPAPSPEPSPTPTPSPSPSPLPPLAIQFGAIVIGGAGCPDAATEISVSDDRRRITLKTHAFAAELKPGSGLARVTCAVAIPVGSLPPGTRLVIAEASAEGSYWLARGAAGKASLEAFLAGQMSDPAVLSVGSADAATQGGLNLLRENAAAGGCEQDEIVRLNATLLITQSPPGAELSSLGFASLETRLELAPCEQQAP